MAEDTGPIVAAKRPSKAQLKAGERVFWRRCGRFAHAGHQPTPYFQPSDLTTWKKAMAELSGVAFGRAGVT